MNRSGDLVQKKYREYLLSTMSYMLSIYIASIVDGILVGRLIGPESFSAINLTTPVVYFKNIIFVFFITGGCILAAQRMGARDQAGTDKIFTLSLLGLECATVVYAIVGCLTASPLARLLAGNSSLYGQIYAYLIPLWALGPLSFVGSTAAFLRLEGWHKLAVAAPVTANVINLCCDYIFIRFFNWGIAGAGWATVVGYSCALVLLLPYYRSKERSMHFTCILLSDLKLILEIFKVGLSAAIIQLCNLLKNYTLNMIVLAKLGDIGSQLISVVNAAMLYALMFAEGASSSMSSISGALYGEGDGNGLRHIVRTAQIVTGGLCFIIFFCLELFPVPFARIYKITDPEVLQLVSPVLRIASLSFLFIAPVYVFINYYQSTKQENAATLLSALQGAVLLIPLFYILSFSHGNIMWLAYTIAPAASLLIVLKMMSRKAKAQGYDDFMMIPKPESTRHLELSIDCTVDAAELASQRLIDYCRECGLSGAQGNSFGVAVEELCTNISRWAGLHPHDKIDIFFSIIKDQCVLKIRDAGVAFNPVEFYDDNAEKITGLKLVRGLFKRIEYNRAIGFNITILTAAHS